LKEFSRRGIAFGKKDRCQRTIHKTAVVLDGDHFELVEPREKEVAPGPANLLVRDELFTGASATMGFGIDLNVFTPEILKAVKNLLDRFTIGRNISGFKKTEDFGFPIPEGLVSWKVWKRKTWIAQILIDKDKPFGMIEEGPYLLQAAKLVRQERFLCSGQQEPLQSLPWGKTNLHFFPLAKRIFHLPAERVPGKMFKGLK
jgi:hypothetical protein